MTDAQPIELNLTSKAWAKPFVMPERKGPLVADATTKTTIEACGEWLQKSLWATQVKKKIERQVKKAADGVATAAAANITKERRRAGGSKLTDEDYEANYYEILGVDEETAHLLTPDELQIQFRKRCVETHPDKMPDHSDKLFKQVQRAFEIFTSEDSRRAYDSSRLFDDSIPPMKVAEDKYYETFAPVFERNAKFSLDQPLPQIGDDDTPMDQVKKFYDAWFRYRSWRDFSSQCELEKVEEEMEREEKRYIQRENQRKLDKMAKEEMKRIRALVDSAHDNDPRIKRAREAELAAQEKAKADREAERERLQLERTRAAREAAEAEKRAAEAKVAKAKNDKEALKELRVSLMAFFKDNELLDPSQSNMLCDDEVKQKNINWLSQKSNADQLATFMEQIATKSVTPDGEGKVEAVLFFNACIKDTEEEVGQNRYGEAIKSKKQKQKEEEERLRKLEMAKPMKDRRWDCVEFDAEETVMISRGAVKFPEGTANRPKQVATMLKDSKKFSEDQITRKVAELEEAWTKDASTKPVAPDMSIRARLVRHLQKYNPDKVDKADAMLEKYKGKEEDWIKAMVKKFGPEPEAKWQ